MRTRSSQRRWSSIRMVGLFVLVLALQSGGGARAATTWFGGLTQAQRNQYVLNTAYSYLGATNQCNCKEWARTVVQVASYYGDVTIPSTCPNANGWYWCLPHQDVREILWTPYAKPIYAATPGNIVQMNYGPSQGPHTAIVWSISSTNVCFIDANFYLDCRVTIHPYYCQPLSDFVSNAPYHMVYEVTGH